MEEQNNAEVVETVVSERQTFHANVNRFDEEHYQTLDINQKVEYLSGLVNHSVKYDAFWNISLPLDSDPAISNEIISSFELYGNKDSKEPLMLYKADVSSSGKSFVIVWSSFKNESVAVFRVKK